MTLRGNLFVKTFIGFWLVTTAILGSWMLTNDYFASRPPDEGDADLRAGPPHRFMLRVMYDLQNMGADELPGLIESTRNRYGVNIFMLTRQGNELLQRKVPPQVAEVAQQLHEGRQRVVLRTAHGLLLGHNLYRRDAGLLHGIFLFPPPRHTFLHALGNYLWLRIGLAILISGLVCYGLSRLLTGRLRQLQLASRRLADGELDTRLQVRERGGDESDELARDFNSMAQQLQERVQAQKRLLADVSHELRSPLARLRVALALAQEDKTKTDSYLQRIERETERLEDLIGQLLASQSASSPLDAHIDLVPLLQQLCEDANFEGQASGKQLQLHTRLPHAIVSSTSDLLHKSFENILRNALTHTHDHTEVTIELDRVGPTYRIRVEDNGPGVPQAELDHIFGEFYRVDTARSRDSGGYGLGLAIARRAIARHGGSIHAENTDRGLRITVTLPAQDD